MSFMFKKKSLHLCFFKIKCLPTSLSPPLTLEDEDEDEDNNHYYPHKILISNTNDNANHVHHTQQEMMMKNYNSIFDLSNTPSSTTFTTTTTTTTTTSSSSLFSTSADTSTDDYDSHLPDFPTVCASQRFFVSSPGQSNSILDSSPGDVNKKLVGGGVPVKKDSPDPYSDFRRSMQEMIQARECDTNDNDDEWEFLHELLLCYLTLNPKHTHKYIVEAFSDVIVSMMSSRSPMAEIVYRLGDVS